MSVAALRFLILAFASAAFAHLSHASITANPKFKVEGLVIVWGGNSGFGQIQPSAQIGKSVRRKTPLLTPNSPEIVLTGHILTPLQHTKTPLHTLKDAGTSFYVASNTAFNIDAQLAETVPFGDNSFADIALTLQIDLQGEGPLPFGSKAQYPHSAGPEGGLSRTVRTLADLQQNTRVFTGNQRTAAAPGTISEQSVRFKITPQSSNTATKEHIKSIVFTVFIP